MSLRVLSASHISSLPFPDSFTRGTQGLATLQTPENGDLFGSFKNPTGILAGYLLTRVALGSTGLGTPPDFPTARAKGRGLARPSALPRPTTSRTGTRCSGPWRAPWTAPRLPQAKAEVRYPRNYRDRVA